MQNPLPILPLRLKPGEDLRISLLEWAKDHAVEAAFVLTGIGSLENCVLRWANQSVAETLTGYHEILQLSGLVSLHGVHLHMTVGNAKGEVRGGHVAEGCRVYTTAEIVLGIDYVHRYLREADDRTGYPELHIEPRG